MRILIVRNNYNAQAIDASVLLTAYLSSQGVESVLLNSADISPSTASVQLGEAVDELVDGVASGTAAEVAGESVGRAAPEAADGAVSEAESTSASMSLDPRDFDLAVVLGGDGTILRTAGIVAESGVPLLGLNYGHFGFLANASDEGVVPIVAAALAGDLSLEHRANLSIDVITADDDYEDASYLDAVRAGGGPRFSATGERRRFFALNELAITRGPLGGIVDFSFAISGVPIASLKGDGLIVATATGSTGYALSAGGPVVSPDFEGLVVVPVAPHSLHSRAVLTASNDVVEVDLRCDRSSRAASLFIDGQLCSFAHQITKIIVRRGAAPTKLLRYKREGFYEHAAQSFFSTKVE